MKKKFLTLGFTSLILSLTMCVSCSASPQKGLNKIYDANKENGYAKMVPDSISNIIFSAKKITAEIQRSHPTDTSVVSDTICVIPSQLKEVMIYLFAHEQNFQSNDVVYGVFNSFVSFKFDTKKKQTVFLELDFGLKKWRLLDCKKELICTADMKDNNMQFLYFTRLLFPQDQTLSLLYNNYNTIK